MHVLPLARRRRRTGNPPSARLGLLPRTRTQSSARRFHVRGHGRSHEQCHRDVHHLHRAGQRLAHRSFAIAPAKLAEHVRDIKKSGDKFSLWKKEPFLALTTYIQLVDGFGWDAWRNYLFSFANPSFGAAPKTDDEKRDQFLVRYSKITEKNLGDFFDFWGIPVSSSAKAEVSELERWNAEGPELSRRAAHFTISRTRNRRLAHAGVF